MRLGPVFLVEELEGLMEGYIQFGRVIQVTVPDLIYIIVSVREQIGMKEWRILYYLDGKNGIILFSLIRG